jgi:8-oxo-dGTP diphosphatase
MVQENAIDRHHHIPSAYLVLLHDNKILLLRRFNTGFEDGNYSLIAGHVDSGESFSQCIIREAKEEANILLNPEDIKFVHVMHRNAKPIERVDVFFIANRWCGKVENIEPNKCDDLSWFRFDDIPENTIAYIKQAIEGIKNNLFYSEYGWE